MKHINAASKKDRFDLLAATRQAQAAMMTLRRGDASDDQPSNEHPRCEQWLFVISGSGEAIVGGGARRRRRVKLGKNSLLVIEQGELHQIKNTGLFPLRTINLYVPPAYDQRGQPRPTAKRAGRTNRAAKK